MNDKDILQKLDEIKLLIISRPSKTPYELGYDFWIEDLQGRNCIGSVDNRKYARYRTTKALVADLFHDKMKGNKFYEENRSQMKHLISNIVAMTLYVQESE